MRAGGSRGVIAINETTGERKDFGSINAAARFCGGTFQSVQLAIIRNGVVKGWRFYETADAIRRRIEEFERQLKEIEK